MKPILSVIVMSLALSVSAQDQKAAQKKFVNALNNLAKNSSSQHWAYDGPFTIDSAFHFLGDTLTATFKFQGDNGSYRVRYAAPAHRINRIVHDMYLILEMQAKEVTVFEKTGDEKQWTFVENRSYFHIALVENEKQEKLKNEIEKTWYALRHYYYEE